MTNVMVNCAAPACKARKDRCPGLTWHSFPKDKRRRHEWITAIRRQEGPTFKITPWTRICSRHFTERDFKEDCSRRTLKYNVIPSRFEWNSWGESFKMKNPDAYFSNLALQKQYSELRSNGRNLLPLQKEPSAAGPECLQCEHCKRLIQSLQERIDMQEKELRIRDAEINSLLMERSSLLAKLSVNPVGEVKRGDTLQCKTFPDKLLPI